MLLKTVYNRFPQIAPLLILPLLAIALVLLNSFSPDILSNSLSVDTPLLDSSLVKKEDSIPLCGFPGALPEFIGGEDSLFNYIKQNIHYPKEAIKKNIQGTVYVSFIVDHDGKVKDVGIAKSAHPILDEEAIRVVSTMPAWVPRKSDSKNAPVKLNIPIRFTLSSEEKKNH